MHLEHLAHERYLRRLRAATAVAAGAAVVAAVATVALTSRSSPPSSGGSAGHTVVSVYPVTLATIPLTATASETADDDVFVRYLDGSDSTAQLTGQASSAPDGAVVRLYAQPFPYASAPAPAGAVTLDPAGGSDSYTFQVTPAIATRYQVRLFSTATATTPIAVSPVTTIYVIASFSESGGGTCNGSTCQLTETVTQPPSTLPTEMAKQWYVYIGSYTSSGQPPATLDLDTSAVVSAARQTSPDSYTRTITYTYTGTGSVYQLFCFKDTEAADGTGLPNASGCGDQQVSTSSYLG